MQVQEAHYAEMQISKMLDKLTFFHLFVIKIWWFEKILLSLRPNSVVI
jgi:hypothetical protein